MGVVRLLLAYMADIHCCFDMIVVDGLVRPMLARVNLLKVLRASMDLEIGTLTIPGKTSEDTRVIMLAKHVERRGVRRRLRRGVEYIDEILVEASDNIRDVLCANVHKDNNLVPLMIKASDMQGLKAELSYGEMQQQYCIVTYFSGSRQASNESDSFATSVMMVLLKESCDEEITEMSSSASKADKEERIETINNMPK